MKKLTILAGAVLLALSVSAQSSMPRVEVRSGHTSLIVDDQPFYALAGELHNSSTGSVEYMKMQINKLPYFNTIIAPVSWELLEPAEGQFDYTLTDALLETAMENQKRVVLLWFGSWKNGASTYAPEWVKRDTKRFPLAQKKDGTVTTTLSTFGTATAQADAKAFQALMQHLKEVDTQHTVICVQVENEMGTEDTIAAFTGGDNIFMRDFSPAATKAYQGAVPAALISYLKKNKKTLDPAILKAWETQGCPEKGTWEQVFGKSQNDEGEDFHAHYPYLTEEIFQAWNYATYVEQIASQGKSTYPLPLYVNAWMKTAGQKEPGKYPSGGPQAHLMDIWRAGAPSIDFLAPDIYEVGIFDQICQDYQQKENLLFIPETKVDATAVARELYAFGQYAPASYAPFGIDGGGLTNSAEPQNQRLFNKLNFYLQLIYPELQKYLGTEKAAGILAEPGQTTAPIQMGKYSIMLRPFSTVSSMALFGTASDGKKLEPLPTGVLILQTGDDEFLLVTGPGASTVIFGKGEKSKAKNVSYAAVDELRVSYDDQDHPTLVPHRLNGDETAFGGPTGKENEISIFRVKMYEY